MVELGSMQTIERRKPSLMVSGITSSPPLKRGRPPGSRWAVFVGAAVTLAFLREALTRLARSPAMSAVKGVSASPTEVLFGIGLLMRMLGRIGDDALRRPH
jgi:hypothetical protein